MTTTDTPPTGIPPTATGLSAAASAAGTQETDPFVQYVRKVCGDPGSRAALRRAARRSPDEAFTAHRFLATWTGNTGPYQTALRYQAAAWIATYDRRFSERAPALSLGKALAAATIRLSGRPAVSQNTVESRLMATTRTSGDVLLYQQIPHLLNLLASTRTRISWSALLRDLRAWPFESGEVTRRWMGDYYRALPVRAARTDAADEPLADNPDFELDT